MGQINYSYYEIKATLKIDQTLPPETIISLDNCKQFSRNRITSFGTVKNIYDFNCVPMSSLILDSLSTEEYYVLTKGLVFIEIILSIDKKDIYKNIYKIVTSKELVNETSKIKTTSKKLQLILKSYFVYNFMQDNNFYNLNKVNVPSFNNLGIYNDTISYIINTYGNSIIGNSNISDNSISVFNNYFFSSEISNFNHLVKLINTNRISNSVTLFGIDECFAALTEYEKIPSVPYGTSSEIIAMDLQEPDSIHYVNSNVIQFIKKYSYEMTNIEFVENYFSNKFLKSFLQSKVRYKNNIDNQIFDLPAIKKNFLKLNRAGANLPIDEFIGSGPDNIFEIEGNLILNDVEAYRENISDFVSKQPKILKVSFKKATLDIFKLGKRIDIGNLTGISITVAAELEFNFTNDKNPEIGVIEDKSNHICSGTLYILNWLP